jgi:hypothetical protein
MSRQHAREIQAELDNWRARCDGSERFREREADTRRQVCHHHSSFRRHLFVIIHRRIHDYG